MSLGSAVWVARTTFTDNGVATFSPPEDKWWHVVFPLWTGAFAGGTVTITVLDYEGGSHPVTYSGGAIAFGDADRNDYFVLEGHFRSIVFTMAAFAAGTSCIIRVQSSNQRDAVLRSGAINTIAVV